MSPSIRGESTKASTKRRAEAILNRDADKRSRTSKNEVDPSLSNTVLAGEQSTRPFRMNFANGALRITRTRGRILDKNCINLADVIDGEQLVSACIYAFFIAREELYDHLPLSHVSNAVPIYVGRDSNPNMDEMVGEAMTKAGFSTSDKVSKKQLETLRPILQQMHHQRYGKNCHAFYAWASGSAHSKILILVYPTFLRLVITSCNMMAVDTELNDNHWYIHDLPQSSGPGQSATSEFENGLLSHLEALGTPHEFINSIKGKYDYSAIRVHLVTSVPGVQSAAKAESHGLLRLRKVVKSFGLDLTRQKARDNLRIEICAASIGNLSAKWLDGFFDCAIGSTFLKVAHENCEVPRELKIFYPTTDDVVTTDGTSQPGAANIGCHTRPWLSANKAVKDLFHHYHSKDTGRIFHQKLIMAYDYHDTDALPYYLYVGSANLSQSAWGALEKDSRGNKETSDLKLTKMSNFECGVVIPGNILQSLLEPESRRWHESIVPYDWTAEQYDLSKDKPWNDPQWVQGFEENWNRPRLPCRYLRLG
ncbi:tyrosyl-DNA phosphodiesterase-domain-containing protein [Coniella lustricola]|uniref:Tyrosyl-DNA phosphodiesterase-domain-containing protein n=1 Tax=Coniella lustricola TaxID=2025994 RepID=A0A2T3AEL8_9PEZI|nr:tyrosyl-DNA phosphodiesterase-domain-containing protein [Coniella lustricola]